MTKPQTQPIGILGGTFDPIHQGHLQIALIALQQLHLQKIHFIPCFQPPHRNQPIASPNDRLAMVKLAIGNNTAFNADDREIKRGNISYTIDTLKSLRQDYPDTPLCLIIGTDAFQELQQWHHWKELIDYAHLVVMYRQTDQPQQSNALIENKFSGLEQIDSSSLEFPLGGGEPSLRSVLCIHDSSKRGSQQRGKPKCEECIFTWAQPHVTEDISDLSHYRKGVIYFLMINPILISATKIRNKIKARSQNLKNELPGKVLDYIKTHHLYSANSK
ncbi:MAG: nicotinate (nicotinamide) nucleotide adenylyltransferase [Gammaproteobacteria bacterium GWF2_41_13]|nr:MAG: nicotinate (nicotinamide) nucleotide adenylyltransferase [Gammaproteobacteria bacterium GWF2_41_13]